MPTESYAQIISQWIFPWSEKVFQRHTSNRDLRNKLIVTLRNETKDKKMHVSGNLIRCLLKNQQSSFEENRLLEEAINALQDSAEYSEPLYSDHQLRALIDRATHLIRNPEEDSENAPS